MLLAVLLKDECAQLESELKSSARRNAVFPLGPAPGYPEAMKAVRYIRRIIEARPRVGVILGSGLGGVAKRLRNPHRISYDSIPYFAQSTVPGHAGELCVGSWHGVSVAILAGRMHVYEGYTPADV